MLVNNLNLKTLLFYSDWELPTIEDSEFNSYFNIWENEYYSCF